MVCASALSSFFSSGSYSPFQRATPPSVHGVHVFPNSSVLTPERKGIIGSEAIPKIWVSLLFYGKTTNCFSLSVLFFFFFLHTLFHPSLGYGVVPII